MSNRLLAALSALKPTPTANPMLASKASLLTEGDPPTKVDDKLRADWNAYTDWLEKKGLKGKADLDANGKGYQLFDEYVKANPTTSLSRAKLPALRQEFISYRNDILSKAKQGKANISTTPDNFMKFVVENEKTGDPNYPGMNLTQIKFPQGKLNIKVDDKLVKTENLGFQKPGVTPY
jgi:hypothetical protein